MGQEHGIKIVLSLHLKCLAEKPRMIIDLYAERTDIAFHLACSDQRLALLTQHHAADIVQRSVLVFKMIVECGTDHARAVTDLFDRYLLEGLFLHEHDQALCQKILHPRLALFHTIHSLSSDCRWSYAGSSRSSVVA